LEYFKLALMGGAVVVSAAGVLLYERHNRRRAERLLQRRPALDPARFGQVYFGEARRAQLAAEVREILAEHVPYSLAGLAPDDAFVQDLRMDALDSMSTVEFALGVEEHFGIKIPDADAERILTFRQLLDYLDTHVPKQWAKRGSERAVEQMDAADEVRDGEERRGPRS